MIPATELTADLNFTLVGQVCAEVELSLPNYHLLELIGRGAFGEIWRARQVSTDKEVAVKLFPQAARGATREVERLARVGEHPHVVPLLDANFEHRPPFMVIPLLAGSLGTYRRQRQGPGNPGTVSPEQAMPWMLEVCKALVFIHRRGVVHGDLKPDNVLLDAEGRSRLADFGQAQAFGEGALLGTLFYMPIEQVWATRQELEPEIAWDIYALGATFYYLLSGCHPRSTDPARQDLLAEKDTTRRLRRYAGILATAQLVPLRQLNPAVTPRQALIVERCLELNPARRYLSAQGVMEELELIQRHPYHWLDALAYRGKCALVGLGIDWLFND